MSATVCGLSELGLPLEGPPAEAMPTLLSLAIAWADDRWGQLPPLDVADLCYNLARLGAQPGSAWIEAAVAG